MNAFIEFFRALTEYSEDPHFLLKTDGIIISANPAAAYFLKCARVDLENVELNSFLSTKEPFQKFLRISNRTSNPVPAKLTWQTRDGGKIRMRTYGYHLPLTSFPEDDYILLRVASEEKNDQFLALNITLEELEKSQHQLLAKSKLLEREIAAHHQTENSLQTANTELKNILNSLESVVYVADMRTHEILFLNRYARDVFGDKTGKLCWQIIQKNQTGPCIFCTNKYLLDKDGEPGPAYIWEFQNTWDGRWYHIQDKAIRWVDGRLVRIEIATDITERKLLEASITLNEERLKALWRLNQLTNITDQEITRYALEEAVKLTRSKIGYFHYYDEELPSTFWSKKVLKNSQNIKDKYSFLENEKLWAEAVKQWQPLVNNDYQNKPDEKGYPEGQYTIRRHLSVPIIDNERMIAVAGVINKEKAYDEADKSQLSLFMNQAWSIMKQKSMEHELLKAKEEWESTFDAIEDVVTVHDREMRIIKANKTAGKMFRKNPKKLIGKTCYQLFRGTSQPCEGCPEILTLKHHKTYRADVYHYNLGKTFEVSSSPIVNGEGLLTGTIHIAKDITEQKELEEKLRQAQKMEAIGNLAGGIAHDFNNILAPILGYADLVLEQISPASQISSDIKEIVKAANRAKDLVKQILSFSRQTNQVMQKLEPHIVTKEALKLLRHSLPSYIEIKQGIRDDCGSILGDSTQLQQIVMNLGTNAYHAMKETGGTLTVNLSPVKIKEKNSKFIGKELRPGKYVKLEISDTGHGMDPNTLDKAFEPYFTTKQKGEGTGLGLAVVHGLVKNHNGHITVYSGPEQGTTFHVYFPQCYRKENIIESKNESLPSSGHERILILDDEEPIVELVQTILTRLGYKVTGYSDSEKALAEFTSNQNSYDLVITDMTMPKITGLQLTYEIHAIRPGIPVILCTGFSELVDEKKAKEAGISRYLTKPMNKNNLAQAVREVLDNKS